MIGGETHHLADVVPSELILRMMYAMRGGRVLYGRTLRRWESDSAEERRLCWLEVGKQVIIVSTEI